MEIRRQEGLDDLRPAVEAYNRAWRVGFRGLVPEDVIEASLRSTDDEALEALESDLVDEPGQFLVADREGAIVGYVRTRYAATAEYVSSPGGEIVELYVDPAHWRQGVGSALLAGAVDWLPAMTDGISTAVLADDERARSFLEANDMTHEETIEDEVGCEPFEHAVYRVGFED